MKKIVLFGTGAYAKKYKAVLDYLQLEITCFVDNDKKKWGSFLYQKKIIRPEELYQLEDYCILISCTMEEEIREQLKSMGLAENLITLPELLTIQSRDFTMDLGREIPYFSSRKIIIELYEGHGRGGTEYWAANMGVELEKRGKEIVLLGGEEQQPMDEEYENKIVRIPAENTIERMVERICNHFPCVFINNFGGTALFAAVMVKKKYPDLIKIISVVHNDNISVFQSHMMFENYIDKVFCVSERIRKNILEQGFGVEESKVFTRPQPAMVEERETEDEKRSILRIGYACRLVKPQKRADLLPVLIEKLEQKEVKYCLQIAGEGDCLPELENYILQHGLHNKVKIVGQIAKKEMKEFWKCQDVFVNISEFEGMSLSMVEAMSCGCVPVVTNVSGTEELITNGENGYICDIGDLDGITNKIKFLAENNECLKKFQAISRDKVREKCDKNTYWNFWLTTILNLHE